MSLFEDNSRESLIDLSNKVEQIGYKSLLLVYDSFLDNTIVNVSSTINKDHTFKYIIAVRTYAVSPEFLASAYESFEKMAPGRVTFNIIPGNIKFQETSLNDVVFIEDKIKTKEQRDIYTLEWLKKYNKLSIKKNLPPLMLSGHSIDFQKASIEYGLYNIIQMSDFLNQYNNILLKNNNQMISAAILIKDYIDENNKEISYVLKTHQDYTLYGNEIDIVNQINQLELKGVSDILVHSLPVGHKSSKIHEFIKKINDRVYNY